MGGAVGVSVCNFNEGGRIAACRATSSVTSAKAPDRHAPDDDAAWHLCRADTSVTGNVSRTRLVRIIAGGANICAMSSLRAM